MTQHEKWLLSLVAVAGFFLLSYMIKVIYGTELGFWIIVASTAPGVYWSWQRFLKDK